jgi:nucleoside-diphosphate-sugar epimerase
MGCTSMKLVIIGLGYSAQAFVAQRGRAFSRVTGTVRGAEKAARLGAGRAEVLVFDGLGASPALVKRISEADAVLISAPPGDTDPALTCLSDALRKAPRLGWIGYLSTVGVYGDHGGAWVDEDTPCRPESRRSIQRCAVERQWLAFGRDHGKAVHIFRLSGIYGPGRNALVKLRDGTARRLVKPGQVFNRIHVADIAGALAASIDRPDAGRIYNVTDDEPAPPQDVVAFAAHLIGMEPPPEVPFDPAALTPMAASFYGENKRVSNRRLKAELGYSFRFPTYREALTALAADVQAA